MPKESHGPKAMPTTTESLLNGGKRLQPSLGLRICYLGPDHLISNVLYRTTIRRAVSLGLL